MQTWFYEAKARRGQKMKMAQYEIEYLKKCCKFLPIKRLKTLTYCRICKMRCKTVENLNAHLLKTHQVGEPFQCEICGKQYRLKWTLHTHTKN